MLLPMTDKELSECYFRGTSRAGRVMEELYEDLHDALGNPIDDIDLVSLKVNDAIKKVRLEVDIIKTAVEEKSKKDDHYFY